MIIRKQMSDFVTDQDFYSNLIIIQDSTSL